MVLKKTQYMTLSQENYEKMMTRYKIFLDAMGDPDKEPVSPYAPLKQKFIEELELIREVSRELQKKKEEDINKAAQAAKEAEEEASKKAEADQEGKEE